MKNVLKIKKEMFLGLAKICIEFFRDIFPWSLSTNRTLSKNVKVTITNKKTNKITKFEKITPNKFSV